jgi:hypothetical protein
MILGQRLAIWSATLALVLLVGVYAWQHAWPSDEVRLELRQPSLPLPNLYEALIPGRAGEAIVLIVIENTPEARPQSGLADACLVYAMPTEARITRFLAAYCTASPTVIGPVRSARGYMLEIASDLGAVLVHAGYSAEARDMIVSRNLPVLNEFRTSGPFWRDKTRQAPHNLYTDLDRVRDVLLERRVTPAPRGVPYRFGPEATATLEKGTPAATIALGYGAAYDVVYRYDAERRRYLREQDGRPHTDASGRQVAAGSVITIFVQWRDILIRGVPSSKIDLAGHGRLVVAAEGRAVEGKWDRIAGLPLTFTDHDGRPLVLPPGPVWIELFPLDRPFGLQTEAAR